MAWTFRHRAQPRSTAAGMKAEAAGLKLHQKSMGIRAWEHVFLPNSQMLLMLLVLPPHRAA